MQLAILPSISLGNLGIAQIKIGNRLDSAASLIGAILQFAIHGGLFITAGAGFLLVTFLNWRRITRQPAGGTPVVAGVKAQAGHLTSRYWQSDHILRPFNARRFCGNNEPMDGLPPLAIRPATLSRRRSRLVR